MTPYTVFGDSFRQSIYNRKLPSESTARRLVLHDESTVVTIPWKNNVATSEGFALNHQLIERLTKRTPVQNFVLPQVVSTLNPEKAGSGVAAEMPMAEEESGLNYETGSVIKKRKLKMKKHKYKKWRKKMRPLWQKLGKV
eukprot:CFRG1253T1